MVETKTKHSTSSFQGPEKETTKLIPEKLVGHALEILFFGHIMQKDDEKQLHQKIETITIIKPTKIKIICMLPSFYHICCSDQTN